MSVVTAEPTRAEGMAVTSSLNDEFAGRLAATSSGRPLRSNHTGANKFPSGYFNSANAGPQMSA